MDFQEADRRYAEIKRRQEDGDLTQEEFDEKLKQLMVQDEEGCWWVKSRTTGEWYYHDGTSWVKDTPPGYQAPQAALEDQPQIQQSESLEAQELTRRAAGLYAKGQQHMDAEEWQQALECFEQVQQLKPGYRDIGELLSRVREELASPPKIEVPDLSGLTLSQASSTLNDIGLKLDHQSEIPNDETSRGRIIKQSPEAAAELETGKVVTVTVSSGTPSDVAYGTLRVRNRGIPAIPKGSLKVLLDGEEVGDLDSRGQEIEIRAEVGSRSIAAQWLRPKLLPLALPPIVKNSPPLAVQVKQNEVLNVTCGVRIGMLTSTGPFVLHSRSPSSSSSSLSDWSGRSLRALLGFSEESPNDAEVPTYPHWLRVTIATLLIIVGLLGALIWLSSIFMPGF